MESRKRISPPSPGLILGCLVCCALWGSAFPCIKIGYGLFGIPAHDSASQLLFAACASRLPAPGYRWDECGPTPPPHSAGS